MEKNILIWHVPGMDTALFDAFKRNDFEVKIEQMGPRAQAIDPQAKEILDTLFVNLPTEFIRDLFKDAGKEGLMFVVLYFFNLWKKVTKNKPTLVRLGSDPIEAESRVRVKVKIDQDFKGFELYGNMSDDVAMEVIRNCIEAIKEKGQL
jgi:hypothetical protein